MIPRLLISVGVLLGVGAAAVQAHEVRQIGAYTLVVGFRAEPAFEDVANAIDISINRTADNKAISVRDGDSVDLQVEVQFRDAEDIDARYPGGGAVAGQTEPGFCRQQPLQRVVQADP